MTTRAEQALLDTRYRALVANLPDTVVTLFDPELRIVVAEGAQLTRRGLDPDAYSGRALAESMSADQFEKIAPYYRAALAGDPQSFDIDTPDGEVTYRVQAVPLHDDQGRLLGGLSVGRDVTSSRVVGRSFWVASRRGITISSLSASASPGARSAATAAP